MNCLRSMMLWCKMINKMIKMMIGKTNAYVISTCRYAGCPSPGKAHGHRKRTLSPAALAALMHDACRATHISVKSCLFSLVRILGLNFLSDKWSSMDDVKKKGVVRFGCPCCFINTTFTLGLPGWGQVHSILHQLPTAHHSLTSTIYTPY